MASTTRYEYFQGKAKWAKLTTPDPKYHIWSIVLYPNDESYTRLLELKAGSDTHQGIMNNINKDDDGYYIRFKRDVQKTLRGKVVGMSPPLVLEADGKTPLTSALVGNGSDVTIKVQWYDYAPKYSNSKRGTAVRLESVRVDNLVPFEMNRDFSEEERRGAKGLADQPPQTGF